MGRNFDGKKDFSEKKEFGLREKRERLRYLSEEQTGLNLMYI